MPRISVLLPARNAARTVRAAVGSILRQTERDLGVVCVDDGSTDGTADVLEALAARDPRVSVMRGPGEGIAGALNRGLLRCDAELVARMDADDVAHPERLAVQRAALAADRSLVAVGSRVALFPRAAVRAGMSRYVAWLNGLVTPDLVARDLLVEAPLVHPASSIRRDALEAARGWRDGQFPEDYDLWLRLWSAGGRLTNVPATLLRWRESPQRLTRTDPRYALDRHIALKCAFLARHLRDGGTLASLREARASVSPGGRSPAARAPPDPPLAPAEPYPAPPALAGQPHPAAPPLAGRTEVALWGAGKTGRAFADALRAEGVRVALFVEVDRKKVGRIVRGAPVVSYEEVHRARGLPLLVAVGAPGARDLIRAELARAGYSEPDGFRCVA